VGPINVRPIGVVAGVHTYPLTNNPDGLEGVQLNQPLVLGRCVGERTT
jgi:hypothetical protein